MITEQEFKLIFKLKDSSLIPKRTLKIFNNQIKGAYLLYLEILDIRNKKFKNVDGTLLQAYFEPYAHGFQYFVHTFGSKSTFTVSYIDKHRGLTPFWTYTKYSKDDIVTIKNAAYKKFECQILLKLQMKYSKYGFKFEYRDDATTDSNGWRSHPNACIWWDGIVFDTLFYETAKKGIQELSSWDIIQIITNRDGVWNGNGEILEPIQKVINNINKH